MHFDAILLVSSAMDDWRSRLIAAADKDPRSDRAISLAAKLGPNFVNELRNGAKQSTVVKVLALARELNLSAGHVFSGSPLTADDEADLQVFLSLSPESRQAILALARRIKAGEPA